MPLPEVVFWLPPQGASRELALAALEKLQQPKTAPVLTRSLVRGTAQEGLWEDKLKLVLILARRVHAAGRPAADPRRARRIRGCRAARRRPRPSPSRRTRRRAASRASTGGRRSASFMRKRSLDELPQLFNVVRGEMSFVGPGPERPEYVDVFARTVHRYRERHRAKSGVTGWGRLVADWEEEGLVHDT